MTRRSNHAQNWCPTTLRDPYCLVIKLIYCGLQLDIYSPSLVCCAIYGRVMCFVGWRRCCNCRLWRSPLKQQKGLEEITNSAWKCCKTVSNGRRIDLIMAVTITYILYLYFIFIYYVCIGLYICLFRVLGECWTTLGQHWLVNFPSKRSKSF